MSYAALLLFFVVEYVRPTSYVPALMVLKLNSLVPLGAFVGALASGTAAAASARTASDPNNRVVFGILGLVFLSFLTADVQMFAWDRFTALTGFAIIYWVLVSELTTISRITGVFAVLVAVHVLIAALNPVLFTNLDQRNYIASGSFLGDGNDFALSLCIIVPFCLFLFLTARAWQRPLWMVALLILVACIVLTQSRGGTLGLGAMGLYYWLKNPKKVQTGAMAVVVVVLIAALAPGTYFARMNQIGDTTEGSASARLMAWNAAIRMAVDNPILGVGAGSFPTKIGNEYRPAEMVGVAMTAHSVYFLALGELGVPGLALVLYFIIANLLANRRLAKQVRERHGPKVVEMQLLASTSAALIAFSVAGAFLSALYYPHIYVMAGLQVAVRYVVRERALGNAASAPVPQGRRGDRAPPRPSPAPAAVRSASRPAVIKVLFLSQIVPYPPHGGVLQRGYNIIRELGQRAHVHLLAFVHPDELPTSESVDESRLALEQFCQQVEFFPLWAKASAAHRVAALAAGVCSPRPFSTVAHRSASFQRRVTDALGSGSYQMLHVDTIALNRFLARHPDVPSVLTHHNIESMLLARRAAVETRPLPRWILERESRKLAAYEALVAPRYDRNLVMSSEDARLLENRAPGARTEIVPNGVDTSYFSPGDAVEETPALIYTGGMNMLANRDAVLRFLEASWPSIAAQVPDVRFFAVGQDPPKELRDFGSRDPRVIVTGKVPDIRPYVRQAAVYIVPIRVGGGTRLKVLDAMASGKAIVSTSIGCEGIEVTAGEHLVVADDPEMFAEATVRLLRDPGRRRELGAAARGLVERRYAWSVVGDMLMDAYGHAAAAHQSARRAS